MKIRYGDLVVVKGFKKALRVYAVDEFRKQIFVITPSKCGIAVDRKRVRLAKTGTEASREAWIAESNVRP